MSATINDGGPAFPVPIASSQPGELVSACELGAGGMSLRDWFAGQALQQFVGERDHQVWAHQRFEEARHTIAKAAYNIADAMIAARSGGAQ